MMSSTSLRSDKTLQPFASRRNSDDEAGVAITSEGRLWRYAHREPAWRVSIWTSREFFASLIIDGVPWKEDLPFEGREGQLVFAKAPTNGVRLSEV